MNAVYKMVIGLLVCLCVLLGVRAVDLHSSLESEINKNNAFSDYAIKLNSENFSIKSQLDAANSKLEVSEPIFDYILQNLDAKDMTETQISKAVEITNTTPLDLRAALALVKYSDIYELDYALVLAVIETESNFNQYLVGSSNDRGYMQIIPGTEKFLVEDYGEELGITYDPNRIFEPEYNLALGIRYIHELILYHGDDLNKILTEYNRGPYGLANYYAKYSTYETQYSKTVLAKAPKYISLNN